MKKQLLTKQKIKENIRQQIYESESILMELKKAAEKLNPEDYINHPNVRAMLDLLGRSERAGYDTIVGGQKTITDFSKGHPNVVGAHSEQGPSKAAGKYQLIKKTYDTWAKRLGITDFTPESQDRIAVHILDAVGALPYVIKGDFVTAIKKSGSQWMSLPSTTIKQGKGPHSWSWIKNQLNDVVAGISGASIAHAGELPKEIKKEQEKEQARRNAEKAATANGGVAKAPASSGPAAPSTSLDAAKTASLAGGMSVPDDGDDTEIVSPEPPSAAVDAAKAGTMAGGIVTPPDRPTPAPTTASPTVAGPISWKDIYALNKATIGRDPNMIRPGQNLQLPDGTAYQVRPGDTLSKIASMVSGDDAIGRLIKSKQGQTVPESTNAELQDILRLAGKTR